MTIYVVAASFTGISLWRFSACNLPFPYGKRDFLFPLPFLQSIHRLVMGQIQLQRRDGDIALGQRADVRALFSHAGRGFATDPVIRTPARVRALIEGIAVHA